MRVITLVACAILVGGCRMIPCPVGVDLTYEQSRGRYGQELWVGNTYGITVQSEMGVHPNDCPTWGGEYEEEE